MAAIFQASRDHGLAPENLCRIMKEWAPRLGISEKAVQIYLTENIYYYLDRPCLEGMQLFYRYAHECGALPVVPVLSFLEASRPALI
jgi:chorismate dehydratase